MYSRVLQTTGADPLPYGVEPNRPMLEQLMEFALAQRILTRPADIDELFVLPKAPMALRDNQLAQRYAAVRRRFGGRSSRPG